ncbi:small GTP-binding protein [Tritrichomonas foetus]|uniref:Small GTP-binding protein n=1 Tax=Tritrichomonas foetus TaxID=1144522 RepID=A0A1J4JTG9_9EUKA|nr:small GTP-binding protein [Tritrichomonas foetus]|eukprot:OHT01720.1 small GTP-binding protein [Tritrichomonas foetus]
MITSQADPPFRVVTIGEESVGKTSITNRLVGDNFNPYEPGTIGANYQQYKEEIDGNKVEIQIWDTAGQEKFKSLSPIYFRNAAAAVVVFSLTSKSSFSRLRDWIDSFTEIAGTNTIIFLAGNKTDLDSEFEVNIDEAKDWAQSHSYKMYLTSAKTGDGIHELFSDLAKELLREKLAKNPQVKQESKLKISRTDNCC